MGFFDRKKTGGSGAEPADNGFVPGGFDNNAGVPENQTSDDGGFFSRINFKYMIAGCLILAAVALFIVFRVITAEKDIVHYECDGYSVIDMQSFDSEAVLLFQNKTSYLDKNGRIKSGTVFAYSNPSMRVNDKFVLVFDRNNRKYLVEKNGKCEFSGETNGNIITAAVSKNGSVCYSVDSEKDSFVQTVIYYRADKNSNPVKIYTDKHNYCISLAVSDDGKYVAAAILDSVNAENVITVYIIDTAAPDSPVSVSLKPNTVLTGLDYFEDGSLAVFSDSGLDYISASGSVGSIYEAEESSAIRSSVYSSGFSLYASTTNSNKFNPSVRMYDENGTNVGIFECDGEIKLLSSARNFAACVYAKKLAVYNKNAVCCADYTVSGAPIEICVAGGRVYLLTVDGIFIAGFSVPDENEEPSVIDFVAEETTVPESSSEPEEETTDEIRDSEVITVLDGAAGSDTVFDLDEIEE